MLNSEAWGRLTYLPKEQQEKIINADTLPFGEAAKIIRTIYPAFGKEAADKTFTVKIEKEETVVNTTIFKYDVEAADEEDARDIVQEMIDNDDVEEFKEINDYQDADEEFSIISCKEIGKKS